MGRKLLFFICLLLIDYFPQLNHQHKVIHDKFVKGKDAGRGRGKRGGGEGGRDRGRGSGRGNRGRPPPVRFERASPPASYDNSKKTSAR